MKKETWSFFLPVETLYFLKHPKCASAVWFNLMWSFSTASFTGLIYLGSCAFWQHLACSSYHISVFCEWEKSACRAGRLLCLIRCQTLNPTAISEVPFSVYFCKTVVIPSALHWRSLEKHTPDVLQWKCLSQFGEMWHKLPFISQKMAHINFDDLHNSIATCHQCWAFPTHVQGGESEYLCCIFSIRAAGNHTSLHKGAWSQTAISPQTWKAWYQ